MLGEYQCFVDFERYTSVYVEKNCPYFDGVDECSHGDSDGGICSVIKEAENDCDWGFRCKGYKG